MTFRDQCKRDFAYQIKDLHEKDRKKTLTEQLPLFDAAEVYPDEHGGILFFIWDDICYLFYIFISDHNKGYGRSLLRRFEKDMKKKATRIQLNVYAHNKAAKKLYKEYRTISLLKEKTF